MKKEKINSTFDISFVAVLLLIDHRFPQMNMLEEIAIILWVYSCKEFIYNFFID